MGYWAIGGSPYRAWVISIHSFLACVHIIHLTQIDEASVEKLVAFLDINKMRKNPMVGKFVPYLSWKWYCLNVCLNVCLPQKSSKVNKEVEKPPTEEAPSFIRLQENSSIQSIFKSMAIFLWERGYKIIFMLSQLFCALDISRKGIVGDWKTHFTSEESQDWDR